MPERYCIVNNRLANFLTRQSFLPQLNNADESNEPFMFNVSARKRGAKPCFIRVRFTNRSGGGVDFTAFDRAVLEGLHTLFDGGCMQFTVFELADVVTHRVSTANRRHSSVLNQCIADSVAKLSAISVFLDWNEERVRGSKLSRTQGEAVKNRCVLGDCGNQTLANVRPLMVGVSGHDISGYSFVSCPPLLAYAKDTRQIVSVETPKVLSGMRSSVKNVAVNFYVDSRVVSFVTRRNRPEGSELVILYSTAFKWLFGYAADEDANLPLSRNSRYKIRVAIKRRLDELLGNGLIGGYEEQIEQHGKSALPVKIVVFPPAEDRT